MHQIYENPSPLFHLLSLLKVNCDRITKLGKFESLNILTIHPSTHDIEKTNLE